MKRPSTVQVEMFKGQLFLLKGIIFCQIFEVFCSIGETSRNF